MELQQHERGTALRACPHCGEDVDVPAEAQHLRVGRASLNTNSLIITPDAGKSIKLARYQGLILAVLMRRPDMYFSADVIMEQIGAWDMSVYSFRVQMSVLRRRVRGLLRIHTHWNVGYRVFPA